MQVRFLLQAAVVRGSLRVLGALDSWGLDTTSEFCHCFVLSLKKAPFCEGFQNGINRLGFCLIQPEI